MHSGNARDESDAFRAFAAGEQLYEWCESLLVSGGDGQFTEETGHDTPPRKSRFRPLRLEHDQGPPRGLELPPQRGERQIC